MLFWRIMKYILASKSPRRREILENIGLKFSIITSDADETSFVSSPEALTEELALRKGESVYSKLKKEGQLEDDMLIISADTVVFCNGEILGKPKDREDARRMLYMLSGNRHTVVSGVALICSAGTEVSHSSTYVYFDKLTDEQIESYLNTDEPYDKAGAYGIQGLASLFVNRIEGCYSGVVGFPINLFNNLHEKLLKKTVF